MTDDDLIPENLPDWLAAHADEIRGWPPVGERPNSTGWIPTPRSPEPICQVKACDRTARSLELCSAHYDRFRHRARRAGLTTREYVDLYAVEVFHAPPVRTPERICWVRECDRTAQLNGLCRAHRQVLRYHQQRVKQGVARASDSETGREEAR